MTQMKTAQELQARYYNKYHRMMEFNTGDLVLLDTINLKLKNEKGEFKRKFIGPFRVKERIGL